MSSGNPPALASPTRSSPMYFGGRPRGQGESSRCVIQAPIWTDLNSAHVRQNDGLMWTQTGAVPGSSTMTYGRSRMPSFNEPNTRSRTLRAILSPKKPVPFFQPARGKLRGMYKTTYLTKDYVNPPALDASVSIPGVMLPRPCDDDGRRRKGHYRERSIAGTPPRIANICASIVGQPATLAGERGPERSATGVCRAWRSRSRCGVQRGEYEQG